MARTRANDITPYVGDAITAIDWLQVSADLNAYGVANLGRLLTPDVCKHVSDMYDADDAKFRSRIVMARHGFGRGEYKYWAYPLPDMVRDMRERLYPSLAEIANQWRVALGYEQAVSRRSGLVHRTLSCGGADASDAAASAIRGW